MKPPRGFTLVEVMVALVVVALALGAGLKAAGALTNNAQRLGDVVAAQWCADNALAQIRLARQYPSIGDGEFECQQLGRDYTGKLVVRPTPNPSFRRVDAEVSDGNVLLVRLSTVVSPF